MSMRVLIATAGRSDMLDRTLDTLSACVKPKSFEEVLLVENGDVPTASYLEKKYAESLRLKYIFEPKGNKNRALNRGLALVESGLVVLFDDDIRVDPLTLMAYADSYEQHPSVPFFGGHCLCDYELPPPQYIKELLPLSAKGWKLLDGDAIDQPHALGFNWAVQAEAVREIGGFAEDRGPGTSVCVGDEYQMQKRLIKHFGPGRFVEKAKVWHHVPLSKCNDTWLIKRGYDYGVAKAMDQIDDGALAVIPFWAWRRLATSSLKWLIARFIPSRAYRLKTSYGRAINQGIVGGYRMARNVHKFPY